MMHLQSTGQRSEVKAHVKYASDPLIFADVIRVTSLGAWIFKSHIIMKMLVQF